MKSHKNRKHSNSSFTGVLYSLILHGNGRPFFRYLLLLASLVGRAAMAYKRVPELARGSFADCIEALRECFDSSYKRELYLAELVGCKKRRGEDWTPLPRIRKP